MKCVTGRDMEGVDNQKGHKRRQPRRLEVSFSFFFVVSFIYR
jgi:hypothetical protein